MFILGLVTTAYYSWKRSIEQAALLEFNQKQIEQTIKDQEKRNKEQQDIANQQIEIINKLTDANEKINDKVSSIDSIIKTSKDKKSSDVLKKTIESLSKGSKE